MGQHSRGWGLLIGGEGSALVAFPPNTGHLFTTRSRRTIFSSTA